MTIAMQKVALVTGASRGIGRAVAEQLAQEGYRIIVNFVRNQAAAAETVQRIESSGGQATAIQADISASDARQQLLHTALERYGRVDVLVNNAGISTIGRKDLLDLREEDFLHVLHTNLVGPFFLAQMVGRWMIDAVERGVLTRGIIVNITSISSYTVSTNRADYCMSKAAMSMMTRVLAARLAAHRIRVYEVCPGIIETDMTAPVKEKYDRLLSNGLTPIARWGKPEDVARVVRCLTRDDFDFCTGMCVHVDGGFHIRQL
jgi:NAD(P)-dependent dehydrogenase (short-subunit alcohol dehydrogenase family)